MRKLKIPLIALPFLFLLHTFIYINTPTRQQKTTNTEATDIKHILYWTEMWRKKDFYFGFGSDIFKSCPVTNCFATNNKSLMDVEDFAAILFHGPEYRYDVHGKPPKRGSNQVYVFSNRETPIYHELYDNFENFFNWTMTYRLDSDIIRNYGKWESSSADYRMPLKSEVASRPKKIAWFVSNCASTSNREQLYQEINKHIPVDVYGRCGNLTCDKSKEDCFDLVEKNYKFYFSFENSVCADYVTEKMFYMLRRNVVPIVYGGVDYSRVAPPHSVIDVNKFSNVTDLVRYIKRLDANVTEYMEYFQWKEKYKIVTRPSWALCDLCRKLNEPIQPKIYEDMRKWWYGDNEEMCRGPLDIVYTH